ncbi:MAG: ABC transporter substrate-binding protein [Deltaproteobacteria bacterium]|nr:ABC transporter substrate-binding protein [Deltaproteobacteria bacterium]
MKEHIITLRHITAVTLSCLLGVLLLSCGKNNPAIGPLKVGVLLPMSGPYELGYRDPLEWAAGNINAAGGINGRRIQLVYEDTGVVDYQEAAQRLLVDDSITAVIGTDGSSSTFQLCSSFIRAKKVLVSPVATSADIFRAFGGKKYIWRTVESDIAQMRTMFLVAARDMHKTAALITSIDIYGTTFFDWFGFFATELGIQAAAIVQYDQSAETCENYMAEALADNPDILFVSPSDPDTAICAARYMQTHDGETEMLFTDGGTYTSIVDTLGEQAEGLRGIGLTFDPLGGFNYGYYKQFGEQPSAYAANAYDALLLIAYGLQRSGGDGGEALADAMIEIVDARGRETLWDKDGIRQALQLIKKGELPDISGATGSLSYDVQLHTDVTGSTYMLWQIENGRYVGREYIYSGSGDGATTASALSIFQTLASEEHKQDLTESLSNYNPPDKTGLWAMILSPSTGWANYRHQSDALALYNALRDYGLTDDRIILILADDLAQNSLNDRPGEIFNEIDGQNLYVDVEIDYNPLDLEPEDIFNILEGINSGHLPDVIESTESDNIYLFIVGHGEAQGSNFNDTYLTPEDLSSTLARMYAEQRYRRIFIEVETCFGGRMGTLIDSPGAFLIAGANPWESSFAANYDSVLQSWLSDQFAYAMYRTITDTPDITPVELYESVYLQVNGSHVSAYNYENFGSINEIRLREFLEP